jgi:hypothetical protein
MSLSVSDRARGVSPELMEGISSMRRTSIAVPLIAAAAVVGLSTPAAFAQGGSSSNVTSFGFSVFPTTVAPGGTVAFAATGCGSTATASAPALFNTVNLSGNSTSQTGTTTVGASAKAAQYTVTFTCGTESGTTPLTVSAASTSTTTTTPATTPATTTPATKVAPGTTPAGAVATGVGGSVLTSDPIETAAGAVLLAGAAAGAALTMRRRRNGSALS